MKYPQKNVKPLAAYWEMMVSAGKTRTIRLSKGGNSVPSGMAKVNDR